MKIMLIAPINPSLFKDKIQFDGKIPVIFAPWVQNTIIALGNMGHEVHVAWKYSNLAKDTQVEDQNVSYHFFTDEILGYQIPFSIRYYTRFFLIKGKLKKLLKKFVPDIVLIFGTEHDLAYCHQVYCRYPHVLIIQGFMQDVYKHGPNKYNLIKSRLEINCIKRCSAIIAQNSKYETQIKEINPKARFFAWNFPLDPDLFSVNYTGEPEYDIVFFGRISKSKGIEDIVKAMQMLQEADSSISLRIIGSCSDEYKAILMKYIDSNNLMNNVDFIGMIESRSELFTMVSKARLSVLPTYYDNNPKTVLESMALGVPVVVYEQGAIEGIEDGIISVLQTGDIRGLKENILSLLEDNQARLKKSDEGQKWVKTNYHPQKTASQLVDILDIIVRNK